MQKRDEMTDEVILFGFRPLVIGQRTCTRFFCQAIHTPLVGFREPK